jgi:hypothetical protein
MMDVVMVWETGAGENTAVGIKRATVTEFWRKSYCKELVIICILHPVSSARSNRRR